MRTLITAALVIATAAAHAAEPSTSAKAAELNGYPGPAHVLALAEQLQLTPEQLAKTRNIEASMRAKAKTVGTALIDAEAQLDNLFASKRIDDRALNASLQHIAELQSELRHAHLRAHLQQTALPESTVPNLQ
jgi:Spy/CpxP family protein refolding chaperone